MTIPVPVPPIPDDLDETHFTGNNLLDTMIDACRDAIRQDGFQVPTLTIVTEKPVWAARFNGIPDNDDVFIRMGRDLGRNLAQSSRPYPLVAAAFIAEAQVSSKHFEDRATDMHLSDAYHWKEGLPQFFDGVTIAFYDATTGRTLCAVLEIKREGALVTDLVPIAYGDAESKFLAAVVQEFFAPTSPDSTSIQ